MNYPVNPDLMPALMAVFQHVRTRNRLRIFKNILFEAQ